MVASLGGVAEPNAESPGESFPVSGREPGATIRRSLVELPRTASK